MEKVYLNGRMEENMKVNICMIKGMDLEFIFGAIIEDMKANGNMENR